MSAARRAGAGCPETALYGPVKRFLAGRGYTAKGEVCGCDVVAVHPGPPARMAVVELKRGLTLELVLQGVDRLTVADEVWLAVAAAGRSRARDKRVVRLCRLLGFGLLVVETGRGRVEVLAEPGPYRPHKSQRRRERVLGEHGARNGDPTAGGSVRAPVMTAYRQRALACAALLRDGPRPVSVLAETVPGAGRLLLRDVYGWFARERHGVYGLSAAGRQALTRWGSAAGCGGVSEAGQASDDPPGPSVVLCCEASSQGGRDAASPSTST